MNPIHFTAVNQTNPLLRNPDSPISGSLAERVITVSLPILQMYTPTKTLAMVIGGVQTIVPISYQVVTAFRNGTKTQVAVSIIKVALSTAAVAVLIFFPISGALVSYTYQFGSDFACLCSHLLHKEFKLAGGDLLRILNQSIYIGASVIGGPELMLASLLLQAAKEIYQARQEFCSGRYLEGSANLIYAFLRIHAAKPYVSTLHREWYGKEISQSDLNALLNEASRILSEKPEHLVNLDQILSQKGFKNHFNSLQFNELHISKIAFENLSFNDCLIEKSSIQNSRFSNVKFINTLFIKNDLKNNNFENCIFDRTQFFSSNFSGFKFINSSFKQSGFYETFLSKGEWSLSNFNEFMIHDSNVYKCAFNFCVMKSCFFNGAFEKVNFNFCQTNKLNFISNSFFPKTTLREVRFSNSKLIESDFNEVLLDQGLFENCNLFGSSFNGAKLHFTNFKSSILSETSFFDVGVESSKIEKSELENCMFFDSKKLFAIKDSTPHVMTKPVIAMLWDFSGGGTLIANAMKEAISLEGGIVFRVKFDFPGGKEIDQEALDLLGEMKGSFPRPQMLLKNAKDDGKIAEIHKMAMRASGFINGLFLPGGEDIQSALYGKEMHAIDNDDFARSITEIAFLSMAKRNNLPVLGVCRGSQMINVFLGGTLKAHIDDHFGALHNLKIDPEMLNTKWGEMAHEIIQGDQIAGYSMHHQAVDQLGKGLHPVLLHEGDVEMTISQNGLFVGTQFHPEAYRLKYLTDFFSEPKFKRTVEKFQPQIGMNAFLDVFGRNRNIYKNFVDRASKDAFKKGKLIVSPVA